MGSSVILPAPGQPIEGPDPGFVSGSTPVYAAFKVKDVDPPAALYVTIDDAIVLQTWNSFAGLIVSLGFRFLLIPSGQIIVGLSQFTPASTRAAQSFPLRLGEGYLLNVQVGNAGTAGKRGQTFCQVGLQRGFPNSAFGSTTLLSDYLTNAVPIGWPGGRQLASSEGPGFIRTVTAANPAAGTDWSIVVPTNARWRVIATDAFFVASATVASRIPRIVFTDGVNQTYVGQPSVAITAGENVNVSASTSIATNTAGVQEVMVPLPAGQELLSGGVIKAATTNIQAGDQWSGVTVLVEEWIDT